MFLISLFFWPSPAVALIGAVLLPAAVRVGLPPLAVAMAMNLFGHGIALSGDFVIQGAPKLTADAAGVPVQQVLQASVPLILVMGAVTVAVSYWMMRRDMQAGRLTMATGLANNAAGSEPARLPLSARAKTAVALLIPLLFAIDVTLLFRLHLQGGEATALIGGTAIAILVLLTGLTHRKQALEATTSYLIEGLQFGFKVFGPVIPIAAFFYLGDAAFSICSITGCRQGPMESSMIWASRWPIVCRFTRRSEPGRWPSSAPLRAWTAPGSPASRSPDRSPPVRNRQRRWNSDLDGARPDRGHLGRRRNTHPMGADPAAAICGVSPFELARRNLIPVLVGLAATMLAAILLLALH